MNEINIIQSYINNFRRHLSQFLKPNIGLSCKAYPANSSGAILEFTIGPGIANDDELVPPSSTVNEALANIQQRAFGGNLDGFRFSGTNVITEDNRIILIKGGDDLDEWNDKGAYLDAKKVLFFPKGDEQ